jgi:hypothetical protein
LRQKEYSFEEMEQHYQQSFSVDYSLKEGETLVLQIKNNVCKSAFSVVHETFSFLFFFPASRSLYHPIYCMQRSGGHVKSKFFEQGASNSSEEKSEIKEW